MKLPPIMKKKKCLHTYFEWAKMKERDSTCYLCNKFPSDANLKLFYPTDAELEELEELGYATFAWANGDIHTTYPDYIPEHHFTPLRKNILLFLAAMAGEFDNNNHEKPRRKKK